jgi:hypothetical protein
MEVGRFIEHGDPIGEARAKRVYAQSRLCDEARQVKKTLHRRPHVLAVELFASDNPQVRH